MRNIHDAPQPSPLSTVGLWYPFANVQGDGGDSSSSANGKLSSVTNNNNDEPLGAMNPDQPLDLSAKTSSTGSVDQKNIFK